MITLFYIISALTGLLSYKFQSYIFKWGYIRYQDSLISISLLCVFALIVMGTALYVIFQLSYIVYADSVYGYYAFFIGFVGTHLHQRWYRSR
jgi:hypothetical protein